MARWNIQQQHTLQESDKFGWNSISQQQRYHGSETQYLVNLSYDVNPAMRLGIEWDYIKTKYANYGNPIPGSGATAVREGLYAGNDGSMNAFRFGAWYFF